MIRRSISSASSSSSAIEARQTSGTPRRSSSSIASGLRSRRVGDPQPELGEQAEDPVPRRGPGLHQVHARRRKPLAQGPVLERGHPELGDQVTTAELGQHPGVDLVGLAGERGDVPHLAGVGDLHLPARRSASRSLTQTAPLIISTQPSTSVPCSKTSRASPSSFAGISPLAGDRAAPRPSRTRPRARRPNRFRHSSCRVSSPRWNGSANRGSSERGGGPFSVQRSGTLMTFHAGYPVSCPTLICGTPRGFVATCS